MQVANQRPFQDACMCALQTCVRLCSSAAPQASTWHQRCLAAAPWPGHSLPAHIRLLSADMYKHVRQQTGRGPPLAQKGPSQQPQPSSPAIAAVPARSPYAYQASPVPAASPAPGPSYQDFESESEGSVSSTPGKICISHMLVQWCLLSACCSLPAGGRTASTAPCMVIFVKGIRGANAILSGSSPCGAAFQ